MRLLATEDSAPALAEAVRRHPDAARELLRRTLVDAGMRPGARADSALHRARMVAAAIAEVWRDSFPRTQVERFASMTAAQRRAKVDADSMRWRGNTTLARAGPDSALVIWDTALRMSRAIHDSAGMAATIGNIGAGFYRAEQLDSAELYLVSSRTMAEAIGDRVTAMNALGTLGSVARDRGDVARAQAAYTSALGLRSLVGDRRGEAADHNNLGLLAVDAGDLDAGRAHYEASVALAREHGIVDAEATALVNLGSVASTRGEFALASRRYEDALAIYRSTRSEADAALVLHDLGLLAARRGDYRTARSRLDEALRIFVRSGTPTDLILVRSDLAAVVAATGDLQGALKQLGMAERLVATSGGDAELAAGVALARAEISAQLNELPEAERQYERAEALYRRAGNATAQADAQQGRALLLAARRQFPRALALLRTAARTHARSDDRRPAAATQLTIGHVLHAQGDLAQARQALEDAVARFAAIRDPVGEASALSALGDVELDARAPLVAEALYRRGLARLGSRDVPTTSWHLHGGLGLALRARGALAAAADELRAALSDVERIATTLTVEERRSSFLADKWDVYAELTVVQRALGDVAGAFATSERMRARQMLDLLARGRIAQPAPADSALLVRADDARRRVAELTAAAEREEVEATTRRGADPDRPASAVSREALATAHREYEEVLLALRETESPYGRVARGETTNWREVSRSLEPDEALLEYVVLDSGSIVFVVTHDTVRVIDLDVGRKAIASDVQFARGMLGRPRTAARAATAPVWRAPLRRLHEALLAPVEAARALAGVRRLVIVPNAELHYLPFAALLGSAPGGARGEQFLIERYEIGYSPSASVWLRVGDRSRSRAGGILALAPRVDVLPGSREEVEAIRDLYGLEATVLTGRAASEEAFRSAAGRHGIIHLATYGVLNKHNPLFSFVTLHPDGSHDGRLEVNEVFGLSLRARLIILSACQTALASGARSDVPPGDDWVGLARAFLSGGAENVIATLWAVEDRSTARVMTNLHRALRAGEDERASITAAQRAMLRNAETADPFHWAGFILVGGR